jgi:hypothetical protein
MVTQSAPTMPTKTGKLSAKKSAKITDKERKCTALIFLQWYEEDAGHSSEPDAPIIEPITKPTHCQCHNAIPMPVEAGRKLRADWRVPRPDRKLRSVDRLVLRRLRARAAQVGGDTTGKITVRDISEWCEVSHRTAQNALRRLAMQQLLTPLEHESGSVEGRRYRLSAEVLRG